MLQRSDGRLHNQGALRPAVFMDKDGTLIANVPYNVDPSLIRWMPGAEECLRGLSAAGYHIIVVSNQSGVAEGYFPEEALGGVEARLRAMAREAGVELTGFFYCPHAAGTPTCECRKPMPGLIHRAVKECPVTLEDSWLVGDILSDIEAGNRAGCRSILVGQEPVPADCPDLRRPFAVCDDLGQAAQTILNSKGTRR